MPDLQTAINSVSTPPVSVQGVPPVAAPKAARGATPTAIPDIAAESERQQKEIRGYYDPLYAAGRTQKEQIQTERERQLGLPEMQVPKADLQAPVFHPTEMKDMGGILMVLGALAGRKTMAPATAAMNNMAAMMEGMHQGDMEKYNRELATFKDNLAIVKERASEVEKRRKEIIENAKGDMAAIDRNMTELARQEGMDLNMLRQSIQVPEFMIRMQMQMNQQLAKLAEHDKRINSRASKLQYVGVDESTGKPMLMNPLTGEMTLGILPEGAKLAAKPGKAGAQVGLRHDLVIASANNALNRLDEIQKKYGSPTVSIIHGIHPEGIIGRTGLAVGRLAQTDEQRKIDADYSSMIDEAIPALTGGLRGSDSFRNFLLQQLPQPGESEGAAAEKLRVFRENIKGIRSTFSGAYKSNPQFQAPGESSVIRTDVHTISSDKDYDSLPSGTEFIAPDGTRRRKP